MRLIDILRQALDRRATDIHIAPDQQLTLRINGELHKAQFFTSSEWTYLIAKEVLNDSEFQELQHQGAVDLSQDFGRVQCRYNFFQVDQGISISIRILLSNTLRLEDCNLHPILGEFVNRGPGLVLVTGPTGSGKSTTMAAMVEEINIKSSKNIITLESPIEYRLEPKKSLIRQRQVGLHTPSFEKGLQDALREDPDVLVVGEMRDPETMRLTLTAAESGHLVMSTLHSSNTLDAIYRLMMSFQAEQQSFVLSQLADTLIAIVSQRLYFLRDIKMLVPSCEILVANHAIRNLIRKGDISKITSFLQTGAAEGMMTFERYQNWIAERNDWIVKSRPRESLPEIDLAEQKRLRQLRFLESPRGTQKLSRRPPAGDFSPEMTTSDASGPEKSGSKAEGAKIASESTLLSPEEIERQQKALAAKLGLADLPNHRQSKPERRAKVLRHEQLGTESTFSSSNAQGSEGDSSFSGKTNRGRGKDLRGKKQTRILDDGRIEIPEVDIDLDKLLEQIKDEES